MTPDSPASYGDHAGADVQPIADLAAPEHPLFIIEAGQVRLRGCRSRSRGSMAFPPRETCLETGARDMEPFFFGPAGTLYSFATVHVSSTRPVPYLIGYIDFPEGVRVLAPLEGPEETFGCDQPVVLRADGDRWFAVAQAHGQGDAK